MSRDRVIRDRLIALRKEMDPAVADRLARDTISRFLQGCSLLPVHWRARTVALYRAFPAEFDLRLLEAQLASWGARLCYPRVTDRAAKLMEFAATPPPPGEGLDPSGTAWPSGAHGISEPPAHCPVVSPAEIDVVFVPGVAFGEKGERIGMGAGYYDRYLPLATRALRVALAFDFQLLPELEQKPWDQRVEWIWTERREIRLREWHPG